MKRLLLTICLLAFGLAAMAQEKPHLEFEGVAINGKVESVVSKLRTKGFKQVKGTSTLNGKVMGQKASVTVASTPDGETVYLILVNCDTKKNWETVHTCYESMKMQLMARYGDPVLFKEEFASPLAEADPMKALHYGNCTFTSHYSAPGGEIILTITKDAVVQMYFVDTSNAVSLY